MNGLKFLCFGWVLAGSLVLRAEPSLQDGIAAIVNNHVIPLSEVRQASIGNTRSLMAQLAPIVANRLFRAGLPTDERSVFESIQESKEFNEESLKIMAATLEGMIDRKLILDEFAKKGNRLPDAWVDDFVKNASRKDFPDRVTMVKTLHEKGTTTEQYRQDQRDQFITILMVQQNLPRNLVISPKKIEKMYAANPERFKVAGQLKLRLMLFDRSKHAVGEPRKLAQQASARIKAGETFAAVAKEMSDDTASRAKGGDRGWIQDKDADLRKELRSVAFQLPVGQVSEVIDLEGTCFVLMAEERKEGIQKSLVDVREEIELELRKTEEARLQKEWLKRLRKDAFVRYF